MAAPRPQSYLILALATFALALSSWWAWDTFTGLDEDPEAKKREARGYFGPLDFPPTESPPAATPEVRTVKKKAPGLETARPPLTPAEPIDTKTVRPIADDAAEPVAEEPGYVDEREDDPPSQEDLGSRANPSRLVGGVARTNARATQEIRVEGSLAWIGTPRAWVEGLASQRGEGLYANLRMEAPRHAVELQDFFIDRFEVTNHRYWEFLRDTSAVLYRTSDHRARSLAEIVTLLIVDPPDNLDVVAVTGFQMFRANANQLLQTFKSQLVLRRDKTVDLEATYERVKDNTLPPGIDLRFYERAPPGTWPDGRYDERYPDHPVRDVSVDDALAYAVFHGRHVPSETQWEFVARGRNGQDWPWEGGNKDFPELVNGGTERGRGDQPRTLPVFQMAGGASWVGAHQMIGNVSEWTSSFLDAYPNGVALGTGRAIRHVVVRGGSAEDQDRYAMRPAFRGWRTDDVAGAPTLRQRRLWTGFRTARFEERAQSRVPTMHFRARAGRRIQRTVLHSAVFHGFQGQQTNRFQTIFGEDVERARQKPRPGVKTVVVNPLRFVSRVRRGLWAPNLDEAIVSPEQLVADPAPVLYALLHTDVHMLDTWHSAEEPFNVFNPPARLRRQDTPPGTYFIATIQGVPALLKTDFTDVWYVSNRVAPEATLNVIGQDYGRAPRTPRIDGFKHSRTSLSVALRVPLHPTAEPSHAAALNLRLKLDEREMRLLRDVRAGSAPR